MKRLIPGLLMVFVICGLISCSHAKPDPDQQVLDQLRKAGADLSKPHNIEFFLYFPKESSANLAANQIQVETGNVNVQFSADKKNWQCITTVRMVPRYDELVRLRKMFNQVAAKYDGVYDGWGTEVEK